MSPRAQGRLPRTILLFHKPYGVVCQFTRDGAHRTLADFIDIPGIYPAGRLDADSEGLVVLTDDGVLQARIATPGSAATKTYWVEVEGRPTKAALLQIASGVELREFTTAPARVRIIDTPALPARIPPIRVRKSIPTSWLELTIGEGRNRQVRRMTAAVGYPTLRLVRYRVGAWTIDAMAAGEQRRIE